MLWKNVNIDRMRNGLVRLSRLRERGSLFLFTVLVRFHSARLASDN